jgi:hypothetical protein
VIEINLVHKPFLGNIQKKYLYAIGQVIKWSISLEVFFNCSLYSVYVRGSVVHNSQNHYSDIDMVVLLKNAPLSVLKCFENGIDSLLSNYLYPFVLDVKVYGVDKKNRVEPASNISGKLRKRVKRHINFDIYANGVCVWGNKVEEDATPPYWTVQDFIESNKDIYGREIYYLLNQMSLNIFFNGYYSLIKKCIRLASLLRFEIEAGYFGTLDANFLYALEKWKNIEAELCILFLFTKKNIYSLSKSEVDSIKPIIRRVAQVILTYKEKAE